MHVICRLFLNMLERIAISHEEPVDQVCLSDHDALVEAHLTPAGVGTSISGSLSVLSTGLRNASCHVCRLWKSSLPVDSALVKMYVGCMCAGNSGGPLIDSSGEAIGKCKLPSSETVMQLRMILNLQ